MALLINWMHCLALIDSLISSIAKIICKMCGSTAASGNKGPDGVRILVFLHRTCFFANCFSISLSTFLLFFTPDIIQSSQPFGKGLHVPCNYVSLYGPSILSCKGDKLHSLHQYN